MLEDNKYGYYRDHNYNLRDIAVVNNLIHKIHLERAGKPKTYTAGDRIHIIGERSGKKHEYYNGLLEQTSSPYEKDNRPYICTEPYVPFTSIDDEGKIYLNASGGYWHSVPPNTPLIHRGYVLGDFQVWASTPHANGTLSFQAWVNYWEYTNKKDIY